MGRQEDVQGSNPTFLASFLPVIPSGTQAAIRAAFHGCLRRRKGDVTSGPPSARIRGGLANRHEALVHRRVQAHVARPHDRGISPRRMRLGPGRRFPRQPLRWGRLGADRRQNGCHRRVGRERRGRWRRRGRRGPWWHRRVGRRAGCRRRGDGWCRRARRCAGRGWRIGRRATPSRRSWRHGLHQRRRRRGAGHLRAAGEHLRQQLHRAPRRRPHPAVPPRPGGNRRRDRPALRLLRAPERLRPGHRQRQEPARDQGAHRRRRQHKGTRARPSPTPGASRWTPK